MPPPPVIDPTRAATVLESPPSFGAPSAVPLNDRPQFTRPRAVAREPSGTPDPSPRSPSPVHAARSPASSRSPRALVAFFALVALAASGIAAVAVWRTRTPTARARVRFADGDATLALELTRVDAGTRVRCLGHEALVVAGRASIPLEPNTLAIGRNDLTIAFDSTTIETFVDVPHWVSVDVALLESRERRLGVRVRAASGAAVSVDGSSVSLDAASTGVASVPIPEGAERFEHTFVVRFVQGAAVDVERVHLVASAARLDIRNPPTGFATDRTTVMLDADVGANARVTVDGAPIEVHDGHARQPLTLPSDGSHRFAVAVEEPGRFRRERIVEVRRVVDLERAASEFVPDPSMTYAEMSARPERAGALVDVTGRVFFVRVESGLSVVQAMVSPCQISSGCPLWVEYPTVTVARMGEAVRIRGRFTGIQAYRDQASGTELRAPRIDAAFLTSASR